MGIHFTRVGDEGSLGEWGLRGPAEELIPGSTVMAARANGTEHAVIVGPMIRNNPRTGIAVCHIAKEPVRRKMGEGEALNKVISGYPYDQEFTSKEIAALCGLKSQFVAYWLRQSFPEVHSLGRKQVGDNPSQTATFFVKRKPSTNPPPAPKEEPPPAPTRGSWNTLNKNAQRRYIMEVVQTHFADARFTSQEVKDKIISTYSVKSHKGMLLSIGQNLRHMGYINSKQKSDGVRYWGTKQPVLEAEPIMTPETIREAVRAKEQQMKSSGLPERCEAFMAYLKSEHNKHLILAEAQQENQFTDINQGRARQAQEALIIFKHIFGIKET